MPTRVDVNRKNNIIVENNNCSNINKESYHNNWKINTRTTLGTTNNNNIRDNTSNVNNNNIS